MKKINHEFLLIQLSLMKKKMNLQKVFLPYVIIEKTMLAPLGQFKLAK